MSAGGTLRLVMGDHLSRSVSSLRDLDPARDIVLMAELAEETGYVPHHAQKIALILSAMRHFAAELTMAGVTVDYVRLADPANTGGFGGEVARAVARHRPARLVLTEPGEWRVEAMARGWAAMLGLPVEIRPDDRFFCARDRFARWAAGRRSLRMEFFYREMRRETGLLMDGAVPAGGAWNFDARNRKPLPRGARPPERAAAPRDAITADVLALVARHFPDRFGRLESFHWETTRAGALAALARFVARDLPHFGDYQDAMRRGAPFLYHSVISPYLNLGLLLPREVCAAVEAAFRAGQVPINAAEGFIRQILGWREYVRGLYWLRMPGYATGNALGATRPLPAFYWTGATDMACIAAVVGEIRENAYAHHIQRLMVTGNFALLAGIAPSEVEAWYLAVFADAFDWVELPNTHGMALFADGGEMASKPYAASGAYIARMSDYCAGCRFDPGTKLGQGACPFNYLYWNFLMRHRARLAANPRMAMAYRTLDAMAESRRAAIAGQARRFLDALTPG